MKPWLILESLLFPDFFFFSNLYAGEAEKSNVAHMPESRRMELNDS